MPGLYLYIEDKADYKTCVISDVGELNTSDYDYDFADDDTEEAVGPGDEDWEEVEDGGELVYEENEMTDPDTDRAGKKKAPQDNRDNK